MHRDYFHPQLAGVASGRTQIDERAALACSALPDRDSAPAVGSDLPSLWHRLYFRPIARPSEPGQDGHPKPDTSFLPGLLPRRMRAESRLHFHAPIRVGESLKRESSVKRIEEKNYDRSYRQGHEGYPDLVVQGPLLAILLMESLCQNLPAARVAIFSFRALGPVFVGRPFDVCGSLASTGRTADERRIYGFGINKAQSL
ncbi:hypothetical protein SB861_09350 [Paraburkholderia sp. SIMBA_049]